MTNGWSGSGGAAISLLRAFRVRGSAAWGRSTPTLRLAGLGTRLPSTGVGLTGTAVLRGTGRTTVVGVTLRRGLAVGTRRDHSGHLGVGGVAGTRWSHAWLTITHHATSTRGGREVAPRGVIHRTVHITTRDPSSSSLLHTDLIALGDLAFQLLPTNLTALGERDVERLGTDHLVVHLCDGLGGLLGTGVAYETKALGMVFIVTHDFGAGDGSEWLELRAEFFVVNVVLEILDIEVDALILSQFLHLGLLV